MQIVSKLLIVALAIWALLPASVCEALCEGPTPPPCHGEVEGGEHECLQCEQEAAVATLGLSAANGFSLLVALPASVFALDRGEAKERFSPRAPPDQVNAIYSRANLPLLI